MALGYRPTKKEPDPKEIAEQWAFDTVFPAHQKAAGGDTDCLFTGVGTLTKAAIEKMVAFLFGMVAPVLWVRSPEGKNMHKGKVAIQAPNREIVKIAREGLPNFFGVTSGQDVSPENIKASGQTIQRFLQAFGAAYEYYKADHDKVLGALLKGLEVAKTSTPNGVLQAAKGKVQEGTDASMVAWGEVLRPPVVTPERKAEVLVAKMIHTLNMVGTSGASAEVRAVTSQDIDRIGSAVISALKRLDDGETSTIREILEDVGKAEEEIEEIPEPVAVGAE